jgi:predicted nucleotidyltransferase
MIAQVLPADVEQMVIAILRRHGVAHAGVFGSFARGEQRPDSDLDLLVEFEGRSSLLDMAGLKLDLQDLLGRQVDVVTPDGLSPYIQDNVMRDLVVILWQPHPHAILRLDDAHQPVALQARQQG